MCALSSVSKLNRNLLGVLLSDQHCKRVRVLRTFARNLCESALVNLPPTTSVMAGGVGASLPARRAAGFLAFIDRTASTSARLQRLVAASRPNFTTESIQMTPTEAASTMLVLPFSTKNPSLLLISEILTPGKYFVSMSAGLSFPATFVILIRSFRTKS